ncbi:uncharacterized protein LOC110978063 [Acanthaster planci]|uniref:Uncharacterized protein LOC110978063 n=1 Tax=Acanthaster planci TaxID=133434 RepID=A0A8B7Y5F6_ACAPL|nr:uncharacterized protein LOC110978063 [Acanthaster planci]
MVKLTSTKLFCLLGVLLLVSTLTPTLGSKNRRGSRSRPGKRRTETETLTTNDDQSPRVEHSHRARPKKRQSQNDRRVAVSWSPPLPVGPASPRECVCPWSYYTQTDPNRIPRQLPFARCTNATGECRDNPYASCHLHNYTIAVLRRSPTASQCDDMLDDYEVSLESVPVACVCVLPST